MAHQTLRKTLLMNSMEILEPRLHSFLDRTTRLDHFSICTTIAYSIAVFSTMTISSRRSVVWETGTV